MAPLSPCSGQIDMSACGTAPKGTVGDDAALSSGCTQAQFEKMARMLVDEGWDGDSFHVADSHASHGVSPGEQLWSPLPLQGEFDGHHDFQRQVSPGWQPSSCKLKALRKFDVLYSMSLFAVKLPHSQQSCISKCGCRDSCGEAGEKLGGLLNKDKINIDDVVDLVQRDPVFRGPMDAMKSFGKPLSWPQIVHSLTTLTLGNFGLCKPSVRYAPKHDNIDFYDPSVVAAPVFRCPINAQYQTTPQTKRSWWMRTIPALQADAELCGAPSDLIADIAAAGAVDSVQMSQQTVLQEVSGAMKVAHCSVSSLKGNKHMPNQDRAVCASLGMGAVQLLAVLDGHGDPGHVVADVSAEVLPKLLLEELAEAGPSFPSDGDDHARAEWVNASAKAFENMQGFFEAVGCLQNGCNAKVQAIDARESGTTATVVLLFANQKALVAHVGDSRAILATRPHGNWSAPWSVTELTHDHKPDLPAERARIERAGARVGTPNADDPTPRVFSPGQTWPYIAMSRCVGDLHAHTQGVSAVPETSLFAKLYDPSAEEAVLIICSDGVWDVMDAATVVDLTAAPRDVHSEPASAVAREAYARWSAMGYEGGYVDDITVVVQFLNTDCEAI